MYNAGLVLEGGAMRGVYTAGVLDAFLDNDISFASVYGVSAGACHGASFVSGQRGRAFRVNVNYLDRKDYCSFSNLLKTGNLFGPEMLFDTIPNKLDVYDYAAFEEFAGKYFVVITNLETGDAEYIQMTPEYMHSKMAYMQASSSMPLVARTVEIDGTPYLDGCIADSIPVRRAEADGYQKTVVIRTRPRGYRKGKNQTMPLIRLRYRNYPNFIARCQDRHIRYNETLDYLDNAEASGRTFIIAPTADAGVGGVCRDRNRLEALYTIGYKDAEARMAELLAFLDD